MSNCKIYLDNQIRTFHPGSQIKGRLECNLRDNKTVRGVKVRLICEEHNQWTKTETYVDNRNKLRTREVHYSGSNYIIKTDHFLFGSDSGSHILSRGHHVYKFFIRLPQRIPSSFDGPYGSISYRLVGIVDRPFRFDYEDTIHFKVNAPIDLNKLSRQLQQPASYSDEKTVCEWCCQGGQVTMDVEIPKKTFIAGETINLKVDVTNMSNSNVEKLNVTLKKKLTYRVTSPSHDSKEKSIQLAALHTHGVGAHGQYTYNLEFNIPEYNFIPNFEKSRLFEVDYVMKVSCQMPSCTLNLDIDIWDIWMGHIPWREDLPPSYPATAPPAPPLEPSAPPALPPQLSAPSAPLGEDLPPSYNEAQLTQGGIS